MTIHSTVGAGPALQLRHALRGMSFPACRWQLLSWAVHNGASHLVQGRLLELPERIYRDAADVAAELGDRARRPITPVGAVPTATLIATSVHCA